ncbi:two-partner secretion domain-containing protein [Calothrix sp. NIES-2098]|uniref:two-partner secretion domain-containing protein n=1 Tax=Calothrix sp. NIES-2098 TaxID=1954171 RepID=UPI000BBBD172
MPKIDSLFQKFFIPSLLLLANTPVEAQITPDQTLGVEASKITPNILINGANADLINGGAQRGGNLFHSFTEFNINNRQRVYFDNPSGIQNILTRVTGGNSSNILGTLGVNGNANLFLINPNGIVFGQNASLDVRGSFVGTTANGVQFGNQGVFSATNPQAPPLLTVNPSALLFNRVSQNAAIQSNSVAPAGIDPVGFDAFGLRVADGKSLLLVGGNVTIDAGELNAFGGRVELGGLAEPGNVNLLFDGDNLSLQFPENVARADVSLTNQSLVFVQAAGGGDIAINARNLEILGSSGFSAGIGINLGTPETVAGDITLNATGEIKIADAGSGIFNLVRRGAQGSGGNITINSASFSLSDRAQLTTLTLGQGNAGNITIDSGDILLSDFAQMAAVTLGQGNAGNVTLRAKNAISLAGANVFSTVEAGGVGKGGNIDVNAATLSLTNGSQLLTITRGATATRPAGIGDAGNVNVKVTGNVDIAGRVGGFGSGIFSDADVGTVGNGGNITIDAGSFSLRDGAFLQATTSGQGNAGNVRLRVKDGIFLADSNILSTVEAGGVGNGGNIDINAASLSITDSTQVLTITRKPSDTLPAAQGNAGNVNVKVTGAVEIAGEKDGSASGIFSALETGTVGKGGNIFIDAASLLMRDGGQLEASTYGEGIAGNVIVNVKDAVSLTGSADILSTVEAGGVGKGGTIDINAASLSIAEGSQILTIINQAYRGQPPGRGEAGNVNVKVTGGVDIAGQKDDIVSGIVSYINTGTVGKGGNIFIDAASLTLSDRGQLSASTLGQGNAGNVTLQIKDAVSLTGGAYILSTVDAGGVGNGGNIDINAASLSVTDAAQILTVTLSALGDLPAGRGDAGNVNVKVSGAVDIAGARNTFASGIFSTVDKGTVGNGGDIIIDSGSLSLRDGGQLAASTLGQGNAGKIAVNAADFVTISGKSSNFNSGLYVNSESTTGTAGDMIVNSPKITLDNQGTLKAESVSGNGGSINVNSDLLLLRRGAQISTNAGTEQKGGDGGNININSTFIVAAPNENSDITANAFSGVGGNINIRTQSIFGIEARPKPSEQTNDITASSELGVQGQIAITQPEVQPTQGLIELPTELIDASQQIAQICPRSPNAKPLGKFIVTGRGSLPPSPLEFMMGTSIHLPLATLEEQTATLIDYVVPVSNDATPEMIEAQGMVKTANGEIALVANAPQATPTSRLAASVCPVSSQN